MRLVQNMNFYNANFVLGLFFFQIVFSGIFWSIFWHLLHIAKACHSLIFVFLFALAQNPETVDAAKRINEKSLLLLERIQTFIEYKPKYTSTFLTSTSDGLHIHIDLILPQDFIEYALKQNSCMMQMFSGLLVNSAEPQASS